MSRTSSTGSTGSNSRGRQGEHGRSHSCSRRQQPLVSSTSSATHRRRLLARSMHASRAQNSSAPPALAVAAPHVPRGPPMGPGEDIVPAVPGYDWEAWAEAVGYGGLRLPATKRASYAGTTHAERRRGPRSAGSALGRRSSMDTLQGRARGGPVSGPAAYRKLARISAEGPPGQPGDSTCSDSDDDGSGAAHPRCRSDWPAARVPQPAPDFLRLLGVRPRAYERQQPDVPGASGWGHAPGNNTGADDDA
ncbi:hypothetical protein IWQ57_004030, partial [Coemansia nantahalensis]